MKLRILRGNDRQILCRIGRHEFTDDCLHVVLRNKTPDNEIVLVRSKSLLCKPVHILLVVIGKHRRLCICAVSDKRSMRIMLFVFIPDILLDAFAVADNKVAPLDHAVLGDLPVFADRERPLRALPLMSVRVEVEDSAQILDLLFDLMNERTDAAGKDIEDRAGNIHFLTVFDRSPERQQVINNRFRRSDLRNIYIEYTGAEVIEFIVPVRHAGYVILNLIRRLILHQLIDKGLKSTVLCGDSL